MSTNSSVAQRIKTPVSAIGVSLTVLLVITALALILTPVFPHILSDDTTSQRKKSPVKTTTTTTGKQAAKIPATSPVEQVVIDAPVALAEQHTPTQDISAPVTDSQKNPPHETTKPTPAPRAPLAQVQLNDQSVRVGVRGTEIEIDHDTIDYIVDTTVNLVPRLNKVY